MNLILSGHGKMGRMIEQLIERDNDMHLLGVVDVGLFEKPDDVPGKAHVLIDFSHPDNLGKLLDYAKRTGCALVLGTTGLSDAQGEAIREAAKSAAIVHSPNYSMGVHLLKRAVQSIAPQLLQAGFDVEIVETHHNQKADAPSGTAVALVNAVDPEAKLPRVYGREGHTGARGREIGVHALRGGTMAGEHSVFFFGEDETLELRHSATSRRIFAAGALTAARFVCGTPAGLYGMEDVLG
ncbi:MAG: 4-hydroxy-tetrahydrodipicolinate reductase [Eubacteriales bacterium]|nr:4-hydroxy-tetrahydrodipicolinate reductase [Eubacteriales bacterium]